MECEEYNRVNNFGKWGVSFGGEIGNNWWDETVKEGNFKGNGNREGI